MTIEIQKEYINVLYIKQRIKIYVLTYNINLVQIRNYAENNFKLFNKTLCVHFIPI